MKSETNLAKPIADFLRFFLHIHQLNSIFVFTLARYEKQIDAMANAMKVINKVSPDKKHETEENFRTRYKENIDAANKEVSEKFYSVKISELILLYSRLESAIEEVVYLYFLKSEYQKMPAIENIKINLIDILSMKKRDQKIQMADIFIQQRTLGQKYGFYRFESIIEPIFGKSSIDENIKHSIYLFAQIRNLLVHKNGIVDKQFKELFKNHRQIIGEKIKIDDQMMESCISAVVTYASDIIDRIKKKASNNDFNLTTRSSRAAG